MATKTTKKGEEIRAANKAITKARLAKASTKAELTKAQKTAKKNQEQPKAVDEVLGSAPTLKPVAPTPPPARKRMSQIEAAHRVLLDADRPMNAGEIMTEINKRGLWSSPNGKTPEATLKAAFHREITTKHDKCRFAKAGKGLYAAKKES